MTFVDSNVPMYLIGEPHRHKTDAQRALERLVLEEEPLVTDVEVLQEILHRYVGIQRRDAIQPAFDAILEIVDEVFSVTLEDAERAKQLVIDSDKLSTRDAIHVAVMRREKVSTILSFDTGFDEIPKLTRITG